MRGIDAIERLDKHASPALGQVFAAMARGTTCDIRGNPPNPSAEPFITSCDCEYDKKPRMSPYFGPSVSRPLPMSHHCKRTGRSTDVVDQTRDETDDVFQPDRAVLDLA